MEGIVERTTDDLYAVTGAWIGTSVPGSERERWWAWSDGRVSDRAQQPPAIERKPGSAG